MTGRLQRWLAIVAISVAAVGVLAWIRPSSEITLLVYLPGIVTVTALFGLWPGVVSVLISAGGSTAYSLGVVRPHIQMVLPRLGAIWGHEFVLMLVGLFVVILMEMRRRSGAREMLGAQQLAAVLAHVSEAVLVFDRSRTVVSANRAAEDMFSHPPGSLTATVSGETAASLARRFAFTPSHPGPASAMEEVWRTGCAVQQEGTIEDHAQQRQIQALVAAVPWPRRPNGVHDATPLSGVIVLVSDLTSLKQLQLRAMDGARQAAVAALASGLSHDFNHVLDIVRRAASVLGTRELDPAPERRQYLDMIDRAATEGATLVRRLRDYLAGGSSERGPVDLAAIAHDAVELTRPLWRTRPGLEVVEQLARVPLAEGSAHELQRVAVNLLFNAIESLGAAPGRISIRTFAAGTSACLEVEDSGPGIATEARARIFEPYFTTKPHGLGLGLFTARKIVEEHEGQLRLAVSSSGTRFQLELPARKAA